MDRPRRGAMDRPRRGAPSRPEKCELRTAETACPYCATSLQTGKRGGLCVSLYAHVMSTCRPPKKINWGNTCQHGSTLPSQVNFLSPNFTDHISHCDHKPRAAWVHGRKAKGGMRPSIKGGLWLIVFFGVFVVARFEKNYSYL